MKSALGATLAGKEYIEQDDLEEARDKVRWGRADKSRVMDEKEKIATAYHEAGHAVVQYLHQGCRPDPQGDDHPPRPGTAARRWRCRRRTATTTPRSGASRS